MPQRLAQQARQIQQRGGVRTIQPGQRRTPDQVARGAGTIHSPQPRPLRPLQVQPPSGGGGGRGGGSGRTGGGGSFGGGGGGSSIVSPDVREAERRAAEQEAARQRQLDQLRSSIRETPLDPGLVAQFAARERAAQRAIQESEVAAQAGRERAQIDFEQFLRQLDQRSGLAVDALRGESAARNLAFQPAFVGVGMRDIRDDVAEAQGQAQGQRAQFLTGIDRQINQATRARDEEVAAIARERARAQADHRQWIESQLAALR